MNSQKITFPLSGKHAAQAYNEGWGVFVTESGELQVQYEQELAIFKNDNDAWHHIIKEAVGGSQFHIEFIRQLKIESPDEYALWVNEDSIYRQFVFCTKFQRDRAQAFANLGLDYSVDAKS